MDGWGSFLKSWPRSAAGHQAPHAAPEAREIRVWDPGVRLFHWLLVATVATLLATGFFALPLWLGLHLLAGYVLISLVLFRLVWGFTGTTYSRFRSFLFAPRAVIVHLRHMVGGQGERHLGHNPLGALMVFALLVLLVALIVSGLVALGGADKQGPLAWLTSFRAGSAARELHETLAFVLLGLIALHLLGVVFETLRSRESLLRAMITGRKQAGEGALDSVRPNWLATIGGLALAMAIIVPGWLSLAAKPALGVPPTTLDAAYKEACGDCHTAHHPSLATAGRWRAIMAGLDRHYGEVATLETGKVEPIRAYLVENAAERWDTKAAQRLGRAASDASLRISSTRFWQRRHRNIAPDILKSKPVGGAANCSACHADADSGRFRPQAISIPAILQATKETAE